MAMESAGVAILRKELDACGGNGSMSVLSVRVKWGQNDLEGLGNIRTFINKYPDIFKLERNTVYLLDSESAPAQEPPCPAAASAAAAVTKAAAAAPAAATLSKAATVAAPTDGTTPAPKSIPQVSAAGVPVPKFGTPVGTQSADGAIPKKRPADTVDESPESKAARKMPPPVPPGPVPPGPVSGAWATVGQNFKAVPKVIPAVAAPKDVSSQPKLLGAAPVAVGPDGKAVDPVGSALSKKAAMSTPPKAQPPWTRTSGQMTDGPTVPPPPLSEPDKQANGDSVPKGGLSKAVLIKTSMLPPVPPAPPPAPGAVPLPPAPPPVKSSTMSKMAPPIEPPAGVMPHGKWPPPVAQPMLDAAPSQPYQFAPTGRKPWEEDALGDEELKAQLAGCKECGIELELLSLAKRIAPSEEYRKACQKVVALLRQAVITEWSSQKGASQPLVEVCGSIAQNTEIDSSDVDVAFRLMPGLSADSRDAYIKQLRERLQQEPQCGFLAVSDGMQLFPHNTAPLTVELKDVKPRTVAHLLLGERHAERGLVIDDIISQLCDTFEHCRDLVRLVKLWAVNQGLANHHEGYMNGMAWTLLVIFFLQRGKYVQPFSALAYGGVPPSVARPQLSALLRQFFEFLSSRDSTTQRGLSVTHGREFQAPLGVSLFLEDPVELQVSRQQRNLADRLGETQWSRILDEARKAAERLNVRPPRWFHWAEIFDSSDLPVAKIAKLQPLSQLAADTAVVGFGPGAVGGKGAENGGGAYPFHPVGATTPMPTGSCGGKGPVSMGPGFAPHGVPFHQNPVMAGYGKGPGGKGNGRF